MDICVGRPGCLWWFPFSRPGLPVLGQVSLVSVRETESRFRPYLYTCPPGSRMAMSDESWMVGASWPPLGAWLLGFPRCDVTFGGVTWPAWMRGFSGERRCGPLDLEDLMVETVLTFRISRSLGPINSGPNSVETLCFFFVSCLITDHSLAHSSENWVISRPLRLTQSCLSFL